MIYRAICLTAAICFGLGVKYSHAQERWQGAYVGGALTFNGAETSVQGSSVHRYKDDSVTLGVFGGYNFARPTGFVWGPDVTLSGLGTSGSRSDAVVGATVVEGSFLLSPRVRIGYATDNVLFYGLLGFGISDLGVKQAGSGGTDLVIGSAIGAGLEVATSDRWSARIEVSRFILDVEDRSFNGIDRDANGEINQLTIGLSRRF